MKKAGASILPVTITNPFVRRGLEARQTLLQRKGRRERLPFYGLFTTVDLPANAFVGYYMGNFYDEDDPDIPRSHYAVSGSGFTVVPPDHPDGGVDPQAFPLAMMNEPPAMTDANVGVVEWTRAGDALPHGGPANAEILVVAMHTCKPVRAGQELYFYYGNLYDRRHYGRPPYNVGRGCPSIPRQGIPLEERPRYVMLAQGTHQVPEGLVYV